MGNFSSEVRASMSRWFSVVLITLAATMLTVAQSSSEREIRSLDQAAAKAILERDDAGIDRYFASDSITNNPRGGQTVGNEGVKALFRNGVINYASFERVIESVQLRGNVAVVMGNETLTIRSAKGEPGPPIRRRYTNVWMKSRNKWQIIARHANVICD